MALTVQASGTQTAVIGTEHVLVDDNATAGVWIFTVNTKNMVGGDVLELRVLKKTLTGDTNPALAYAATYSNTQGDAADAGSSAAGEVVKVSVPITSSYVIAFTLKQTAGTGRSFDWTAETL